MVVWRSDLVLVKQREEDASPFVLLFSPVVLLGRRFALYVTWMI